MNISSIIATIKFYITVIQISNSLEISLTVDDFFVNNLVAEIKLPKESHRLFRNKTPLVINKDTIRFDIIVSLFGKTARYSIDKELTLLDKEIFTDYIEYKGRRIHFMIDDLKRKISNRISLIQNSDMENDYNLLVEEGINLEKCADITELSRIYNSIMRLSRKYTNRP